MSEETQGQPTGPEPDDRKNGAAEAAAKRPARTFLVVVDGTPEMQIALRYACRRAKDTHGRVALLHVIETGEVQQWAAVEDMIRAERREEAEQMMHKLARSVQAETGGMAVLHVREGSPRDELLKLIGSEENFSILVLAAVLARTVGGNAVTIGVIGLIGVVREGVVDVRYAIPVGVSVEEVAYAVSIGVGGY